MNDYFQDNFVRFDLTFVPIEDCYKILEKGGFKIPPDEAEKVDTFRHKFKKMLELAGDVQVQTNGR